jgi:hypothetical protein
MFCCPEGAQEFSPGFQPWEPSSRRIRPEGAEDLWTLTGQLTHSNWSPFRAIRTEYTVPRVEPWAEFFSPFGAAKLPRNSRHSGQQPKNK